MKAYVRRDHALSAFLQRLGRKQRHNEIRQSTWNRKGQSLVEVALITPLVLIALMIPLDFTAIFQTRQRVQNVVRETSH